jgi:glucose-1-phosphate cytidylyltransferase
MKVAILAGGYGTRFGEETARCPKPLLEVGGRPILWHVMMQYTRYGFSEFVIALGYRGDQVKSFFASHLALMNDVTIDFRQQRIIPCDAEAIEREWLVHLVETGTETPTGARLKRLAPRLGSETFMLAFCDGVSNLDMQRLLRFHRSHGKLATVTAVRPPPKFGAMALEGDVVSRFVEKPLDFEGFAASEGWVSGGFFVLEPGVFDYVQDDLGDWSRDALPALAADGQLVAYRHDSFWQCMDTPQERSHLESLWQRGAAPWKTW